MTPRNDDDFDMPDEDEGAEFEAAIDAEKAADTFATDLGVPEHATPLDAFSAEVRKWA